MTLSKESFLTGMLKSGQQTSPVITLSPCWSSWDYFLLGEHPLTPLSYISGDVWAATFGNTISDVWPQSCNPMSSTEITSHRHSRWTEGETWMRSSAGSRSRQLLSQSTLSRCFPSYYWTFAPFRLPRVGSSGKLASWKDGFLIL